MIALEDLLAAGARLGGEAAARYFTDFSYDSRLTRAGELFLALRTPRADGHDYIPAALAAGAAGVVCTWAPSAAPGTTVVLTDDPQALVQRWAARRLRQVGPTVVAVTGSVGKTSTKRAIATLLAAHAPTFQSRQSFNSLLGLPIALARLRDEHRFAVLEFGADRFGEIAQLAALFPPRIAVITAVGAAHLNVFGSLEGVAHEKGALVEALPPDGWAVLNGDDPYVAAMRARTAARVLTFGQGPGCDLRASAVSFAFEGTRLRLHWQDRTIEAAIPLLGEPAVTIALAAVGAALASGMPLEAAARALSQVAPLEGRLRALPARGATLIDDTFNATLPSVLAALRTLAALPARRRIAVLGALTDAGAHAEAAYSEIGALAGTVADRLVCKGDWGTIAVHAARQARPNLEAAIVHTAADALHALPADLGAGDLVLVKGGAAARMERIVAGLLDPQIAPGEVLVRQEPAWRSVRVGAPDRPTWVRIDLDAIAHNIRRLRAIAGVPLMVVLKGDAYGHGAVRVARTAVANGAAMLAVATLGEARALREADITAPILVLGYTPPWQAREAVLLGVACTVFDLDTVRALADAAVALQRQASVHVKVDSGMARLGLQPAEVGPFVQALHACAYPDGCCPRLRVEGIYTHFATADSADESFARLQLRRFESVLAELTAAGLRPPLVHAANSAALLRFPQARFDMVRPGLACYGLNPSPETPLPADFRPALSFHTEVAQVKTVPAGTPISYGGAFVTQRPSVIATIPVGYADGFRRAPPWREVLVRGQRAPVVGRICMDYALVDVTAIAGVRRGDAVVLIGTQGDEWITADEVADWLGTINYEVVTTIFPRVPREVDEA
jgi:alanine racemase